MNATGHDRSTAPLPRGHATVGGGTDVYLCWTQLGARLGYTTHPDQREQILTAIGAMTWTDPGPTNAAPIRSTAGPAVRAILTAVLTGRPDQPRPRMRVGVAPLDDRRQLIGLDNTHGAQRFLIDLDTEAIHVLARFETVRHRIQPAPHLSAGARRDHEPVRCP